MVDDEPVDLFAIRSAGGRHNGERSMALPQRAYGDPANSYEFPSERLRKEEARRVERAKKRGGK